MSAKNKGKKLEEIQEVALSITETKEMIMHQMRQVIKCGPKYHGLLYFIVAEAGSGKTQIQGQILEEMMQEVIKEMTPKTVFKSSDYEYFKNEQKTKGHLEVLNLAAKDAQDFSGLPFIDPKTALQKFAHPDSLPKEGYGIIFYDEANRVFDLEMKATLLSLWMDRGVNGHYLGDGYIQVAAGNPFNDPRFETEKFDVALSERIRIIKMVPTIDEVMAFLQKKYKSHFMLDFLAENKEFCSLVGDIGSSFSPRMIDKAMEITFTMKDNPKDKFNLTKTILRTYFGHSSSMEIERFLNDQREISFDKIVTNPKLAEQIKNTDMPTMTKLADEVFKKMKANFEKDKQDLTKPEKVAMVAIAERINSEAKAQIMRSIVKHEDHGNLFDFMVSQNKDFMKQMKSVTEDF